MRAYNNHACTWGTFAHSAITWNAEPIIDTHFATSATFAATFATASVFCDSTFSTVETVCTNPNKKLTPLLPGIMLSIEFHKPSTNFHRPEDGEPAGPAEELPGALPPVTLKKASTIDSGEHELSSLVHRKSNTYGTIRSWIQHTHSFFWCSLSATMTIRASRRADNELDRKLPATKNAQPLSAFPENGRTTWSTPDQVQFPSKRSIDSSHSPRKSTRKFGLPSFFRALPLQFRWYR